MFGGSMSGLTMYVTLGKFISWKPSFQFNWKKSVLFYHDLRRKLSVPMDKQTGFDFSWLLVYVSVTWVMELSDEQGELLASPLDEDVLELLEGSDPLVDSILDEIKPKSDGGLLN